MFDQFGFFPCHAHKQGNVKDIGAITFDKSSDIDNVKAAKWHNFPHFFEYSYFEVDTYFNYFSKFTSSLAYF